MVDEDDPDELSNLKQYVEMDLAILDPDDSAAGIEPDSWEGWGELQKFLWKADGTKSYSEWCAGDGGSPSYSDDESACPWSSTESAWVANASRREAKATRTLKQDDFKSLAVGDRV